MPSLPVALQESANEAGTGEFTALDPGVYTARLNKITVTQTKGNPEKGTKPAPMWGLEFDAVYDVRGEKCSGRLWTNLVLVDSVSWKIGQFFGAFGVPTNTNTDELENYRIRLRVEQRVQEFGKNTGKVVNDIGGFEPLVEGDIGYEAAQKMRARLTGAGAKKAAPAKAATKAAAKPAAATSADTDEPTGDETNIAPDADDGIDF